MNNFQVLLNIFLVICYCICENVIDVDDFLSAEYMPTTLLMLENPISNKTIRFSNMTSVTGFDGSLDKAIVTMGYHRQMMNEYLCRNYIAEQIVQDMSMTKMNKRMGVISHGPGLSTLQSAESKSIQNGLLEDEGSSNYKNWLSKSTTLEDIYKHYDMDKRSDAIKDDEEKEDETYDEQVIGYDFIHQPKPIPKQNQSPAKLGHSGEGIFVSGGGGYPHPHPSSSGAGYFGGSSFGGHSGGGSHGGGHHPIIHEQVIHVPKHHHHIKYVDKKEGLTELFEIALTALAFLSFGMFIVHVVMCISMTTNTTTTAMGMMMPTNTGNTETSTAGMDQGGVVEPPGGDGAGMTAIGGDDMGGEGMGEGDGGGDEAEGGGDMTEGGGDTGDGGDMGGDDMGGGGMEVDTGGGDDMEGGDASQSDMGEGEMEGGDMGTGGGDDMEAGDTGAGEGDEMEGDATGGDDMETGTGDQDGEGDEIEGGDAGGDNMGDVPDTGGSDGGDDTPGGSGNEEGMDGVETQGDGDESQVDTEGGNEDGLSDGGGGNENGEEDIEQGGGDDNLDMNSERIKDLFFLNGDFRNQLLRKKILDRLSIADSNEQQRNMIPTNGFYSIKHKIGTGTVTGGTSTGGTATGGTATGGTATGGTATGGTATGGGTETGSRIQDDGITVETEEAVEIPVGPAFDGMGHSAFDGMGSYSNMHYRSRRDVPKVVDPNNYALNELARRVLISIEAATLASTDNGVCLRKTLCENNRYSRQLEDTNKIWIPVWGLGMSWLTSRLGINAHPYTSMLDSLKASILGLGKAKCEILYQNCDLHRRRRKTKRSRKQKK